MITQSVAASFLPSPEQEVAASFVRPVTQAVHASILQPSIQDQLNALTLQVGELQLSYERNKKQLAHIQEVFFDGVTAAGHIAIGAVNTVPDPAANSGIDTILVFITPTANSTQTVKLPTAATLAAANASGVTLVRVKNLSPTFTYGGVTPGNGTDTIDGATGTFIPANDNTQGPGGAETFETVGTTGFSIS